MRLDLDAALGAAERHVDDRALVGHERGERHHLVLVHLGAVADAALGRQLVVAVLGAPGVDHLDGAVLAAQRKVEPIDAIAAANLIEQSLGILGEPGRFVERSIDFFEEIRLSGHGPTIARRFRRNRAGPTARPPQRLPSAARFVEVEQRDRFAVLREVQSELLVMLVDAQRRDQVDQLVEQPRATEGEGADQAERRQVLHEQHRRAGDEAAVTREHRGQHHARHATDAVAGEDVERVVDRRPRLPVERHVAGARGHARR